MLKDRMRRMAGIHSGEDMWAKAALVELAKADGPVDLPSGVSRFGYGAIEGFWTCWGCHLGWPGVGR